MTRFTFVVVLVLTASAACARENAAPAPTEFELGAHRVAVIVPTGWEALDQGRQKRFRHGEFSIVLENLGPAMPPARDPEALVDWALAEIGAAVGHDQRREVKSRRTFELDGHEAIDIETWNRLDHSNPQRILFLTADDDVLTLHTERMAFQDSLDAFDAIRDSLHFVSARR